MDKSLGGILAGLVNRRVTWTDKDKRLRFGTLREVRGDHAVVQCDVFGSSPPKRIRIDTREIRFAESNKSVPESHVTYSIWKEPNHLWRWEIKIDQDVWRRRRGYKSHRTAEETLKVNMLEAEDAARNQHPPAEAMAASYLWRSLWEKSGLGPADFYDRLSAERKQICREFIGDVESTLVD